MAKVSDGNGKKTRGQSKYSTINELLTPQESEFCTKLAQRLSPNQAALEVGWANGAYGYQVIRRPHVQKYLEKLKIKVVEEETKQVAKQIAKSQTVTRAKVLERLNELMDMSPAETNGTIAGQVKAAENLAKILGMVVDRSADVTKEFSDKTEEELDFFIQHGFFPTVDSGQSGIQ